MKNLTSKKFKEQFEIVLNSLEEAGYNNYWKVLNAKDYGIPQNRERVFIISIRKDIDDGKFEFPGGFPLELRLRDMLDEEADEKFYLSDVQIERIKTTTYVSGSRRIQEKEYCDTLCARDWKDPKCVQVGQIYGTDRESNPQAGRIYSADGISPTMDSCSGGNRMPKVAVREATKKGYAEAVEGDSINIGQPNSKTRRGRVGKQCSQTLTTSCGNEMAAVVVNEPFIVASRGRNPENPSDRTPGIPTEQRLEPNSKGMCNTLTTVQKDNYVAEPKQNGLRIRKLTPKECFRLMGFDDEDFYKAEAVNSNTQLYKQAGNSIVVDVIEAIYGQLFDGCLNGDE